MNRSLWFIAVVTAAAAVLDPLRVGIAMILVGGVGLSDRARAVVAFYLVSLAAGVFPESKCRECAVDIDVAQFSISEHLPWAGGQP
jgi:hypothetical protein